MTTVVVAGASGLVGSHLVQQLCADTAISKVVCLVRRPLLFTHDKIDCRVVDFADARSLQEAMPIADSAFCCLGTTMRQAGSRAAFLAVDRDAVLAFADAARAKGVLRFLLVSSIGADPRSVIFYSRTKGEVEEALRARGFDIVHIARPSMLDGERSEKRPGEGLGLRVGNAIAAVVGSSWTYAPIAADRVARALLRLARDRAPGFFVHESRALQKLGA